MMRSVNRVQFLMKLEYKRGELIRKIVVNIFMENEQGNYMTVMIAADKAAQ